MDSVLWSGLFLDNFVVSSMIAVGFCELLLISWVRLVLGAFCLAADAKDLPPAGSVRMTLDLASLNERCSFVLIVKISFSSRYLGHVLEDTSCGSLQ